MNLRSRQPASFLNIGLAAVSLALLSGCDRKPTGAELVEVTASPTPDPAAPAPPASPVKAAPEPTPEPTPIVDKTAKVTVLCYHRFEEKPRDGLAMKPSEFEAQMQALKDQGIAVISMQDFLAWRRGEGTIPARSAIITIDDGYDCGYTIAWPILQKFGYPFTMFIYTKYVASGGRSITWEELEQMRDAGVDIGSHTITHSDLRKKGKRSEEEYLAFLNEEMVASKEEIEQRLAVKVTTLAYPYGNNNEVVRKVGREAGYEALFTVYGAKIGHDTDAAAIGRYALESTKPEVFKLATSFGAGGAEPAGAAIAQAAAVSMITVPMEGETITDRKPLVKANLATLGEFDPASIEMRVSGLGIVPASYDVATGMVEYQFTQPIRHGSCTVVVSAMVKGRKVQTRWSFQVADAPEETVPAAG